MIEVAHEAGIPAGRALVRDGVEIEVWSDVVCPWCYIGKRRLEAALARFPHRDEVRVQWRSFELDPSSPREVPGTIAEILSRKYGVPVEQARAMTDRTTAIAAGEGLVLDFERSRHGSTFDAHRLLQLAKARGLGEQLEERLFAAHFSEGRSHTDVESLVERGVEVGLDPDEVRRVLASDAYAAEVRADEAEARQLGATGVPFFVVDRRYGVAGAQPAELLLEVLERAWADTRPLTLVTSGRSGGPVAGGTPDAARGADRTADPACDDGTCSV